MFKLDLHVPLPKYNDIVSLFYKICRFQLFMFKKTKKKNNFRIIRWICQTPQRTLWETLWVSHRVYQKVIAVQIAERLKRNRKGIKQQSQKHIGFTWNVILKLPFSDLKRIKRRLDKLLLNSIIEKFKKDTGVSFHKSYQPTLKYLPLRVEIVLINYNFVLLSTLTGKKHRQIKLQRLQKVRIWTFA